MEAAVDDARSVRQDWKRWLGQLSDASWTKASLRSAAQHFPGSRVHVGAARLAHRMQFKVQPRGAVLRLLCHSRATKARSFASIWPFRPKERTCTSDEFQKCVSPGVLSFQRAAASAVTFQQL